MAMTPILVFGLLDPALDPGVGIWVQVVLTITPVAD